MKIRTVLYLMFGAIVVIVLTILYGTNQDTLNSQIVFGRSEEHTSELQSRFDLVCRLLLEKKKRVFTISAIPSLTTTVVFTSVTRVTIFGSDGCCCTLVPGCGVIGLVGVFALLLVHCSVVC